MQEGVIQALYLRNSSIKTPLLAAVGPLQFEVVQFRLESEYWRGIAPGIRTVDGRPLAAAGT